MAQKLDLLCVSTPGLKQLKKDAKKACAEAQQAISLGLVKEQHNKASKLLIDTTECILDVDAELKRRQLARKA